MMKMPRKPAGAEGLPDRKEKRCLGCKQLVTRYMEVGVGKFYCDEICYKRYIWEKTRGKKQRKVQR